MQHQKFTRRSVLAGAIGVGLASIAGRPVHASTQPVFSDWRGRAIRGTDPVAYFTEGKPVAGNSSITHEWNGATWQFASAANRDKFAANPERYAPQFGGYCAWAVAQGYTASTVPEAWDIVDGKLYMNYSTGVQTRWRQDVPGNIRKGNANWPRVLNA